MKNRKLILILSLVLALTMSLGGTLAYLTDTDADVNVMTVGRVSIKQNEEERNDKGDLVAFTNNQTIVPAVYSGFSFVESPYGVGQICADTMENIIDKFVTVTNTGNTPAYVRTYVAIERPVEINNNFVYWMDTNDAEAGVIRNLLGEVEIDGVNFKVLEYVYTDAVGAKETTVPSLQQVFLDKDADNNDVKAFGDEWEIRVLSQAVQANGFENAEDALNAAFPAGSNKLAKVAEWMTKEKLEADISTSGADNARPYAPVTSVEDLLNAEGPITAEVPLKLEKDETAAAPFQVGNGGEIELDLAGNTLTAQKDNGEGERIFNNDNGELTISNGDLKGGYTTSTNTGGTYATHTEGADAVTIFNNVDMVTANGAVSVAAGAKVVFNGGSIYVDSTNTASRYHFYVVGEGSEVTINGGDFTWNQAKNNKRCYIYAASGTTVYVNGGNFGVESPRVKAIIADGTVIITGGTFGFNPTTWVAEGYEAVQNGTTWTVQAK